MKRQMRYTGLLVVLAAFAAPLGYQLLASPSSTAALPAGDLRTDLAPPLARGGRPPGPLPPRAERAAHAADEGAVPAGTTVFDGAVPAVANLDPALLDALRRATADAADDGVELVVNSGWRSPDYQARLLREAVAKHGSESEAARWVATPERSAHVSGDAVDVGFAATAWLAEHGAGYGLCQVYRNELWHYELRPAAADRGCPPLYADPTHDPRMRE